MRDDLPTTYAQVDQSALRHNARAVLDHLDGRASLCAVVKANAYGHGLLQTSRLFAEAGAEALGVADIDEAIAIRQSGLETRIMLFHPLAEADIPDALEHRLTITVTQDEHVAALASACEAQGAQAEWQLAVDVGLGRSGTTSNPAELLRSASRRLGRGPWGIWTHLGPHMAPESLPTEPPPTWEQARDIPQRLRHLDAMRERLREEPDPPVFHAAASCAMCDTDALLWDMVRVGTALYGAYPPARPRILDLKPALSLRSRIVELRTVPAGIQVGYGGEFRTKRETVLATVPVGLFHGVGVVPYSSISLRVAAKRSARRALGRRGRPFRAAITTVREASAPIVGRISLNECAVDVTDVAGVALGDAITVPTRMTSLNPVVPRVFIDEAPG
ncbi:MAG TPA: alanine racemase [Armatimonadota bacterium]|nr:alanine racemase [Armatimonadota bacterium]